MLRAILSYIGYGEDVEDGSTSQHDNVKGAKAQPEKTGHKSESSSNRALRVSLLFGKLAPAPLLPSQPLPVKTLSVEEICGSYKPQKRCISHYYGFESSMAIQAGNDALSESQSLDDEQKATCYPVINFSFFKKSSAATLNENKT